MNAVRACAGMSRAASRSGAGHPPVRSASRCSWSEVRPATPIPSKKRATSASSNRRASARTSTRSPDARSRATPERRVRPRRDDQLDLGRAVPQELGQLRADLGGLRAVVVVQDEDEVARHLGQLVVQQRQGDVGDPAGPASIARHRGPDTRRHGGQRRHDVAQNRSGSQSPASSDTQANRPGRPPGPTRPAASSCRTPRARRPASGCGPDRRAGSRAAPGRLTEPRGGRGGASLALTTPRLSWAGPTSVRADVLHHELSPGPLDRTLAPAVPPGHIGHSGRGHPGDRAGGDPAPRSPHDRSEAPTRGLATAGLAPGGRPDEGARHGPDRDVRER